VYERAEGGKRQGRIMRDGEWTYNMMFGGWHASRKNSVQSGYSPALRRLCPVRGVLYRIGPQSLPTAQHRLCSAEEDGREARYPALHRLVCLL
jgi:hypothetical protein